MLCEPLIYLFQLHLEKGVFPDNLKIAKVTPAYKAGDSSDIRNYRPISVLPCFSNILERLIYNRLYKCLKENNFFDEKQFHILPTMLPSNYLTIFFNSFEEEQFTLVVFIGSSKTFDTVDHKVLLKKYKLYGITDKNFALFQSYSSNRKQHIHIGQNSKTSLKCVLLVLYLKDLFLDHFCF